MATEGMSKSAAEEKRLVLAQAEAAWKKAQQEWKDAMSQEASDAIAGATQVFEKFSDFITEPQLRSLETVLKATIFLNEDEKAPPTNKVARKKSIVVPKFEVSGKAWSGRGITPKEFNDWDKTEEGKAWHKAHPKQQYPFIKGYEPTEADTNWKRKSAAEQTESKKKREEAKAKKSASQ